MPSIHFNMNKKNGPYNNTNNNKKPVVIFILCKQKVANGYVQIIEPWHEISNNVLCATNRGLDQPAHMRRLIRAFAGGLNIL